MKKLLLMFALCAIFLSGGILLSACGEDNPPPPEQYNITLETSSDFEITSSHQKATEGETVTLEVTITNENLEIDSVFANETALEKDGNSYSFVMPAQDVTINVTTKERTYQEVLESDGTYWRESVPNQIGLPEEGTQYANQYIYFNFSGGGVWSPTVTVRSTNQEVLPDDALEVRLTSNNQGTRYGYGSVCIDLTKASKGTTYIILTAKSSTMGTTNSTIIKEIEFVDNGEVEFETWQTTVTFDLSKVARSGREIFVQVSDRDWVYGTPSEIPSYFSQSTTEESIVLNITYIPTHDYSISAYYFDENNRKIEFELPEVITGSGSSETGFTQYVDGNLSFAYNGANINITPTN